MNPIIINPISILAPLMLYIVYKFAEYKHENEEKEKRLKYYQMVLENEINEKKKKNVENKNAQNMLIHQNLDNTRLQPEVILPKKATNNEKQKPVSRNSVVVSKINSFTKNSDNLISNGQKKNEHIKLNADNLVCHLCTDCLMKKMENKEKKKKKCIKKSKRPRNIIDLSEIKTTEDNTKIFLNFLNERSQTHSKLLNNSKILEQNKETAPIKIAYPFQSNEINEKEKILDNSNSFSKNEISKINPSKEQKKIPPVSKNGINIEKEFSLNKPSIEIEEKPQTANIPLLKTKEKNISIFYQTQGDPNLRKNSIFAQKNLEEPIKMPENESIFKLNNGDGKNDKMAKFEVAKENTDSIFKNESNKGSGILNNKETSGLFDTNEKGISKINELSSDNPFFKQSLGEKNLGETFKNNNSGLIDNKNNGLFDNNNKEVVLNNKPTNTFDQKNNSENLTLQKKPIFNTHEGNKLFENKNPTSLFENKTPQLFENKTPQLFENKNPTSLFENKTPQLFENKNPSSIFENKTPQLFENKNPTSLFENNTPQLFENKNAPILFENKNPTSLFENKTPTSLFENKTPQLFENKNPTSLFENKNPTSIFENKTPQSFEDKNPTSLFENKNTPILFDNKNPTSLFENKNAPQLFDNKKITPTFENNNNNLFEKNENMGSFKSNQDLFDNKFKPNEFFENNKNPLFSKTPGFFNSSLNSEKKPENDKKDPFMKFGDDKNNFGVDQNMTTSLNNFAKIETNANLSENKIQNPFLVQKNKSPNSPSPKQGLTLMSQKNKQNNLFNPGGFFQPGNNNLFKN